MVGQNTQVRRRCRLKKKKHTHTHTNKQSKIHANNSKQREGTKDRPTRISTKTGNKARCSILNNVYNCFAYTYLACYAVAAEPHP